MKNRACRIALQLASTLGTKSLMIFALATAVIAMTATSLWAHKVRAAKANIEATTEEQAATLDDVMAKLNSIESEMHEQTRALNARLESLEYQNAKLAAYQKSHQAPPARLEMAAEPLPGRAAAPGASPQFASPSFAIPVDLETEVCHKASLSAAAKLSGEGDLKGFVKGNVGLDEFGDGVEADARGQVDAKVGLEVGGDSGFERSTCLKITQSNILGRNLVTTDIGQFVSGVTAGSRALAEKLIQLHMSLPQLQNGAITTGLDNLSNLKLVVSPQKTLQALENPQATFQDVSDVISSIPLPGNVRDFLSDPSSLFPKASDFDPANFCSNFSVGSGGPISTICSKIPKGLADLTGITNAIGDLANVRVDLANIKAGVSNLCGSVNNGISTINGTSVQIPQLAAFQLPDGVSFNGLTAKPIVSLSTHTISIGPQSIPPPFQITPLSCPSL
ncbi:MAG TPA: hypothetical protein VJO53_07380 [Candidatus Acidoferrales bacterium]|nr:hypothetical protein [Candidatus Acidoferrales bacterium]